MRLWADGKGGSAGRAVRAVVEEQVAGISRQAVSRGTRAVNALRNAELNVLKGQRNGKVYRVPGTTGKANKATRGLRGDYGHKLRGGQLYRASAPGEPPARRTGNLRMHWNGQVRGGYAPGGGASITAELESSEPYAAILEKGNSKIAPRPFVGKILEEAMPEIMKIYTASYR